MSNDIENIIAELLQESPELRGREEQLRGLLSELLSARPDASIDTSFRNELKKRLLEHTGPVRRYWHMPRGVYYPAVGIIAAVLILAVIRQDRPSPEVALRDMAYAPELAPLAIGGGGNDQSQALTAPKIAMTMKITSSAFQDGQLIPKEYTCDGEGLRPLLMISDVPAEALSLALIVEDPDAPSGTFTHWTAWNIPPMIQEFGGAVMVDGIVEGSASNGTVGWVRPCPPSGTHRYVFTVFALDSMIDLSTGASVTELKDAIEGHVVSEVSLTGLYQRQ